MKSIKQCHIASYLGISTPFLSEIRKGKKSFSKKKSRVISEITGIPVEKLLFTNGEQLYRAIVFSYSQNEVKK